MQQLNHTLLTQEGGLQTAHGSHLMKVLTRHILTHTIVLIDAFVLSDADLATQLALPH